MRNALRLVLAVGGASIFGAACLLACSDDTSVDTTVKEAGTGDGGGIDSPVETDGGADTAPPFDGGFVLDTFDTLLATEICKSLARCCYGTPTPADGGADGGTFDMAKCVANLEPFGFQGSNLGVGLGLRDAGNVTIDQVSADSCISKIKALSCDLPGTEYTAARAACFGVYSGKLADGASCKGSAECKRTSFCKGLVGDGGAGGAAGTCTAIQPVGGGCGDNPNSLSEFEEACSYRAGGDTGNFCKFNDNGGAPPDLAPADWKCAAAGAVGDPCVSSTWCKDSICDPDTSKCKTPDRLFDDACKTFLK